MLIVFLVQLDLISLLSSFIEMVFWLLKTYQENKFGFYLIRLNYLHYPILQDFYLSK